MKKILHYLTLIYLLMLLVTCSPNSNDQLKSDHVLSNLEVERLNACGQVNFFNGVLLHENVIALFKCANWKTSFPQLYTAINNIDSSAWDHLWSPITLKYFDNKIERDKLLTKFKELDKVGGIDSFSFVINALFEQNFFNTINEIFGASNGKKTFMPILDVLDVDDDTLKRIELLFSNFIVTESKLSAGWKNQFQLVVGTKEFSAARMQLLDELAMKIKNGLSDNDRKILGKLLIMGKDKSFLYQWLNNSTKSSDFIKLMTYSVVNNNNFSEDMNTLKRLSSSKINCISSGIQLDVFRDIYSAAEIIKNDSQDVYFQMAGEKVSGLSSAMSFCPEINIDNSLSKLIALNNNITDFFSDPRMYSFVKYLFTVRPAINDKTLSFSESMYLVDFFAGDVFKNLNAINNLINTNQPTLYNDFFIFLKSSHPESYPVSGELYLTLTQKENDNTLVALSQFWLSLKPMEREFIFNYIDKHLYPEVKLGAIFELYRFLISEFRQNKNFISSHWIQNDFLKEKTFDAILMISKNFMGDGVLADLKRFYSRDQLIKVIEILANGQTYKEETSLELLKSLNEKMITSSNASETITRGKPYQIMVDPKILSDALNNLSPGASEIIKCINSIKGGAIEPYSLILNYPIACENASKYNIGFRIYSWMSFINKDYQTVYSGDEIFNQNGIMSPVLLGSFIKSLKLLDNILPNGISSALNQFSKYLIDYKYSKIIEKDIKWLDSFFQNENELNKFWRNRVINKIFSDKKTAIVKNTMLLIQKQNGEKIQPYDLSYTKKIECKDNVNLHFAPLACAEGQVLGNYWHDVLKSFTKVQSEISQLTPLYLLLEAIIPGGGISIPILNSNSSKYRITIKEFLSFLFDTSNPALNINRQEVTIVNEVGGDNITEAATTLERVEGVIREVNFDHNYLGVSFLNSVTEGNNYYQDVNAKKNILMICLNIPGFRCGRSMTEDDLRHGRNGMAFFDGLLDVNNGRGKSPEFQYGNLLKAIESIFVLSSEESARADTFLPLPTRSLDMHNGIILGKLAGPALISQLAIWIRNEASDSRKNLEIFFQSTKFKKINENFLYGLDTKKASQDISEIINKYKINEWIADWDKLPLEKKRLYELEIFDLVFISSHMSQPANSLIEVFKKALDLKLGIDFYKMLDAAEPIIKFLAEKLESNDESIKGAAIELVNNLNGVIYPLLLEKSVNSTNAMVDDSGMGLLKRYLDKYSADDFVSLVIDNWQAITTLYSDKDMPLVGLSTYSQNIFVNNNFDQEPWRNYVLKSTLPNNEHYDEFSKFIHYLSLRSNFQTGMMTVLKTNLGALNSMLEDLFPSVIIDNK